MDSLGHRVVDGALRFMAASGAARALAPVSRGRGVILMFHHVRPGPPPAFAPNGGLEITPELTTIVVGLTLYTTGFVAEIVRGGILSVGKGQWEAGRALGLRRGQILRLVVIPQMMRVIMPPLTSQYINVIKNSTLSIAVGYPDFLAIMGTVINKSSHAVEGVALILAVYLAINLSLSGLLNWYNRRVALVER